MLKRRDENVVVVWTKWIEMDEEPLGQTLYNFGYESLLQMHFGSFGKWLDFISTMLLLTMPVIDIEPVVDFYCFYFQMFLNNKKWSKEIDLFVDQANKYTIQDPGVFIETKQKHYITLFI